MAQVTRSILLNAPADKVWGVIGDFDDLASWHPAVQASTREESEGGVFRHLDLGGGAVIIEKSMGSDGMSYGYEIVSGPLPVATYRSVLSASSVGDQTVVTWSSTFEPTADGAEAAIAGVYEAGFGALVEKFGS